MIKKFFWSWYALCYDVLTVFGPYQKMLAEIKKRLELQSGVKYKILDAACGTSNLEVLLEEDKDLSLDITAVDFSPFMLNRARKKLKGVDGVNVLACDLSQPLPFDDSTFHRIVTVNVLHFLPSPRETLVEFFRVLKPGGFLVLTALRHDHNPLLVLKSFKHDDEPSEKWQAKNLFSWFRFVFKAFGFNSTAFKFIFIAIFNKAIDKKVEGFKQDDLEIIFLEEGFEISCRQFIYGGQNFLFVLKKSDDFFIKKVKTIDEFNQMVEIRREVFIEEDGLPFDKNDLDDCDNYSSHFIFCNPLPIGTMRFIPFDNKFFGRWGLSFPANVDLSNSVEISKLCFLKIGRDKKNLILFLEFIYSYAKNKKLSRLCGVIKPTFLILLQRQGMSFCYVGDTFLYHGVRLVSFVSEIDGNLELLQSKVANNGK
jgi:ubiquinone/menaquinone biosynthesis C-methylase UbiE